MPCLGLHIFASPAWTSLTPLQACGPSSAVQVFPLSTLCLPPSSSLICCFLETSRVAVRKGRRIKETGHFLVGPCGFMSCELSRWFDLMALSGSGGWLKCTFSILGHFHGIWSFPDGTLFQCPLPASRLSVPDSHVGQLSSSWYPQHIQLLSAELSMSAWGSLY